MPRDKRGKVKKKHKRCANYWKDYDARYRQFDKREIFEIIHKEAKKIGMPFCKIGFNGRNFKITPCQYAALFVLSVFFNMTQREIEQECIIYTGKHIDHSTFGKNIDRIPELYLTRLLSNLRHNLDEHLEDSNSVYIADSTKISLERQYEPRVHALKETKAIQTEMLTIFVEYFPQNGVIAVNDAVSGQSSDTEALTDFITDPLIPLKDDNPVFADRGFDGKNSINAVYDTRLQCGIKLRDHGSYCGIRKKAFRDFKSEDYKLHRGLVEGVFGGITLKGLDRCRYRKKKSIDKWNLTVAATQNLNSYLRVLCHIAI